MTNRHVLGENEDSTLHSVKLQRKAPLRATDGLKATGELKPVGRRGKRLAPGDKASQKVAHELRCLCGCRLPAAWVHLDGRTDTVRHDRRFYVGGCEYFHPAWLDHHPDGVRCKEALVERAKLLPEGVGLEHDDVLDLLVAWRYYDWLALERERRRV